MGSVFAGAKLVGRQRGRWADLTTASWALQRGDGVLGCSGAGLRRGGGAVFGG
jgi:hypothetical protein